MLRQSVLGRGTKKTAGRAAKRKRSAASSRGGVVADPEFDDHEAQAPDGGDEKGNEAMAERHLLKTGGPLSQRSRRSGDLNALAAETHDDFDTRHFHAVRRLGQFRDADARRERHVDELA